MIMLTFGVLRTSKVFFVKLPKWDTERPVLSTAEESRSNLTFFNTKILKNTWQIRFLFLFLNNCSIKFNICSFMPKIKSETRLMIETARLYYEHHFSQQLIANKLGISRPGISRLLQRAREAGIVKIEIALFPFPLLLC